MQEDIEGVYMVCPDCGGRHFLGKNKIVALVKAFCFWHLKVPDRYADIHDGHRRPNVLYLVKL
jgi:hypothetical protein